MIGISCGSQALSVKPKSFEKNYIKGLYQISFKSIWKWIKMFNFLLLHFMFNALLNMLTNVSNWIAFILEGRWSNHLPPPPSETSPQNVLSAVNYPIPHHTPPHHIPSHPPPHPTPHPSPPHHIPSPPHPTPHPTPPHPLTYPHHNTLRMLVSVWWDSMVVL